MTTHADLTEVSDHRIVADWALGEWADRLLEQVGLGVTIVDRHGTVMYSDIATVAPDVIGADSERGGVSGEAIVCARVQFGAAGANIAVVIGNSMPVSGSGSMVRRYRPLVLVAGQQHSGRRAIVPRRFTPSTRRAHCHELGGFERLLSRVDGGFAVSSPSRSPCRSVWSLAANRAR